MEIRPMILKPEEERGETNENPRHHGGDPTLLQFC